MASTISTAAAKEATIPARNTLGFMRFVRVTSTALCRSVGHDSPSWYPVKAMPPDSKYCAVCATVLEVREVAGRQRPVCPACGHVVYDDPKVAAICIVERDLRVLMVKRGNQPGAGLWSMPGGYVDRGEVVEEAAVREVLEETGLQVKVERLVGLFSKPEHPVIVAAYAAREVGGVLKAGPEALDVGFFPLDDLPPLAFAGDLSILDGWKSRRYGGD